MAEIKRTELFGKLNEVAYKSIESATVFCKMRGNPYVELIHWLNQIFQTDDTDLHKIIHHFEIDEARLAKDLTSQLDKLPRGSTSIQDFSPHIELAIKEGWLVASLMFKRFSIRTGDVILAAKRTRELNSVLREISIQFDKIKLDDLSDNFYKITTGSREEGLAASDGTGIAADKGVGTESGAMAPAQMGKQEALKQFCTDLTQQAREGKLDPIVGRDEEIRKIVDILMRRRQNNPILTGEAGVGKTAVVEGFAQRIAAGDVPPPLRNVRLIMLDIGLLQAGASMKGEFENRLKQVIEEVRASDVPIIMFIDEAHTLIGAGGSAGQSDAANLLKPALARGTLRTIAATTWAEYKKYFEKDAALTRRFQNILIDEPDDERALRMMRGVAGVMEQHHKVLLLDNALEASVSLSRRYIPARQLPDKSVSVLDTAAARVAISQSAEPAEVEDMRRSIESLETELGIIEKESAAGFDRKERLKTVNEQLKELRENHKKRTVEWGREKELVEKIQESRKQLQKKELKAADRKKIHQELNKNQKKLHEIQGEVPMVSSEVDEQNIAAIISEWTGIPLGRMVRDELNSVLKLPEILGKRVIGQDAAMEMISSRVRTARASLSDPNKPIAVMMLCGPSGIGKTETALALAEALYGGEQNLITINMSEFQEAHTVSTLKGAPPGYVGYGEGGVLTEAVRKKPYSVVLLDEVEKAHQDVHEIFYQVFDKGRMEDGEGRLINFRNTVILLTTNVGTDEIMAASSDPELIPSHEKVCEMLRPALRKKFPAALLGRLVVVPYYPLPEDVLCKIVDLKLERIKQRIKENYGADMSYSQRVRELIINRSSEIESGARMLDNIITNTILPELGREMLVRTMEGKATKKVELDANEKDFIYKIK
ncbi:type VI secretion system ATPase TssH [Lentisphaerota bacterium ZTH]|nr:type VI secretion system ATPase TssH [Lentisphaerota bacterium]WET05218.1 type VI secretion system ATPase TssH [Lentisphaerota bacterium ZTH]